MILPICHRPIKCLITDQHPSRSASNPKAVCRRKYKSPKSPLHNLLDPPAERIIVTDPPLPSLFCSDKPLALVGGCGDDFELWFQRDMPNGPGCWPNQSPDSRSTRRPHAPCTAAVILLSCVQPDAQMVCETRTRRTQLQCTRHFVYYVANGLARFQENVELWARTIVSIPTSSVEILLTMTAGQSAVTSGPSRFPHATTAGQTPKRHRSSFIYPCQVLLHCKSVLLATKALASDTMSHCNSAWRYHLYFFYLRISIKFPCRCF